MKNLNSPPAEESCRTKEPRQSVGIFLCVSLVLVLLGGIPFLLLFYGAIGAALLGVCVLATLISIQFLLFYPLWNSLNRESSSSRRIDDNC
ncbi:hypothetical protein KOR42_55540 [Thalassoglobus neptunius]|uniref:Uncharacterized protein n=1 Tax=Thalassoglobus neptunius TaxID=1938619 RepID=A0A5C5UUG2_9PLAN|nr:hypothetical protein KOR42_55540 [Thalassoglobus neptunius]